MDTLILVPGLNCTAALFGPQIEALSDTHRVVVAKTTQDDTIAGMAARLLAENDGTFALAGLSMGGYVALEVYAQAPGRVARLALLDTSARADVPEKIADRERLIALAQSGRFDAVHAALWQKLVHPDRRGDAALEREVRAMAEAIGAETFVRQQRAVIGRRDMRELLPGIEIPTLVLVGDTDLLTPPDLAQEMADAIEWASLAIVPDCGHLSTLERPEAVNRALRAWLAT
jgi:pimeloyl-ACP methyl ester carboxylesterase